MLARPLVCSVWVVGREPTAIPHGREAGPLTAVAAPTTLRGNQGGLRWPPQAARAAGPPRTRTGRSINRAKRTARPGRSTPPEGGQSAAVFAADWPHEGALTSTDALGQRSQGYAPPTRRE